RRRSASARSTSRSSRTATISSPNSSAVSRGVAPFPALLLIAISGDPFLQPSQLLLEGLARHGQQGCHVPSPAPIRHDGAYGEHESAQNDRRQPRRYHDTERQRARDH